MKPSPPIHPGDRVFFGPARGGPGTSDPGRITWTYATLTNLLMTAYAVENYQISGPAWLASERYDIAVTVPSGATKDQVKIMWQNLLTQRFGLALHHESKEFQVEELMVGQNGSKLKESAEYPDSANGDGPPVFKDGALTSPGLVTTIMPGTRGATAHTTAKAQPISKLTTMLGNTLHRPVLDKTGLTGKYDFMIDFTLDGIGFGAHPLEQPAPAPAADPGPDLASAVQQQLGLRLAAAKAQIDVLTIDKAEKVPSEN